MSAQMLQDPAPIHAAVRMLAAALKKKDRRGRLSVRAELFMGSWRVAVYRGADLVTHYGPGAIQCGPTAAAAHAIQQANEMEAAT